MPLLSTDRIDWELDDDGDLVMPPRWTTGIQAVRQRIRIKCRLIRGEYFLDIFEGVPLLPGNGVPASEAILDNTPSMEYVEAVYRSIIETVPGVRRVTAIKATLDSTTRECTVEFSAQVAFDDVDELTILTDTISLPVGVG